MVYVDWQAKGICKFAMLRKCTAARCRWWHPGEAELHQLWDDYTAAETLAKQHGTDMEFEYQRVAAGAYGRMPPKPKTEDFKEMPTPPPSRGRQGVSQGATGGEVLHPAPAAQEQVSGLRLSESSDRAGQDFLDDVWRASMRGEPVDEPIDEVQARINAITTGEAAPAAPKRSDLDAGSMPPPPPPATQDLSWLNNLPDSREHRFVDAARGRGGKVQPVKPPSRSAFFGSDMPGPGARTLWKRPESVTEPDVKQEEDDTMKIDRSQQEQADLYAGMNPERAQLLMKQEETISRATSDTSTRHSISPTLTRRSSVADQKRELQKKSQQLEEMLQKAKAEVAAKEKAGKAERKPSLKRETAGATATFPIQQQPKPTPSTLHTSQSTSATMGAAKRMSNGELKPVVGPHPSIIKVSAQYRSQANIDATLQPPGLDHQERSLAEAREDSLRLQGCQWLDTIRRQLSLPIRTYTTACLYFHKFRLNHTQTEYLWSDAAAAALLMACKVEDTLKKSKDILAAAYNIKAPSVHDHIGSDDPMLEAQSRAVIGLERLIIEADAFDFRTRQPHEKLMTIAMSLGHIEGLKDVAKKTFTLLTDLYRTFAPLKQTSATLAFASLELAARMTYAAPTLEALKTADLGKWSTTREEVMETILDALEMYTHHQAATSLGPKYTLQDFINIRIPYNRECTDKGIERFTTAPAPEDRIYNVGARSTLTVQNGHPTPISPDQGPPQAQDIVARGPVGPNGGEPAGAGTLRFMLDHQLAAEEKAKVNEHFLEEWEEYEEEIEVPLPRPREERSEDRRPPRSVRDDDRREDCREERRNPLRDDRSGPPSGAASDTRSRGSSRDRERRDPLPPRRSREDLRRDDRDRDRYGGRDRDRDRERDLDRDRPRPRSRDRDRDRDRRYDDRARDRRYDDRRYEDRRDRRYDDDRRRR